MRFPRFIIGAATALTLSTAAFAGEQFIDNTGFAVSGYDVVAYFDLDQVPVGSVQPAAVPGNKDITATYNGATFAFSSEANKERFVANPEAFVPQYDGHCAYGVAKGGKVPGNPNLWRIVDDKLYLNITANVVGFWEEDIPGNLDLSENNWVSLEPQAASDRDIPKVHQFRTGQLNMPAPDPIGQSQKTPLRLSRRGVLVLGGAGVATVGAVAAQWFNILADNDATGLTPQDAYAAAGTGAVILVDIRRPDEWARTGLGQHAYGLDMRREDFETALLDRVAGQTDQPVALICARGVRSRRMTARLEAAGFTRVIDVPEGMLGSGAGPGWLKRGLPTVEYP